MIKCTRLVVLLCALFAMQSVSAGITFDPHEVSEGVTQWVVCSEGEEELAPEVTSEDRTIWVTSTQCIRVPASMALIYEAKTKLLDKLAFYSVPERSIQSQEEALGNGVSAEKDLLRGAHIIIKWLVDHTVPHATCCLGTHLREAIKQKYSGVHTVALNKIGKFAPEVSHEADIVESLNDAYKGVITFVDPAVNMLARILGIKTELKRTVRQWWLFEHMNSALNHSKKSEESRFLMRQQIVQWKHFTSESWDSSTTVAAHYFTRLSGLSCYSMAADKVDDIVRVGYPGVERLVSSVIEQILHGDFHEHYTLIKMSKHKAVENLIVSCIPQLASKVLRSVSNEADHDYDNKRAKCLVGFIQSGTEAVREATIDEVTRLVPDLFECVRSKKEGIFDVWNCLNIFAGIVDKRVVDCFIPHLPLLIAGEWKSNDALTKLAYNKTPAFTAVLVSLLPTVTFHLESLYGMVKDHACLGIKAQVCSKLVSTFVEECDREDRDVLYHNPSCPLHLFNKDKDAQLLLPHIPRLQDLALRKGSLASAVFVQAACIIGAESKEAVFRVIAEAGGGNINALFVCDELLRHVEKIPYKDELVAALCDLIPFFITCIIVKQTGAHLASSCVQQLMLLDPEKAAEQLLDDIPALINYTCSQGIDAGSAEEVLLKLVQGKNESALKVIREHVLPRVPELLAGCGARVGGVSSLFKQCHDAGIDHAITVSAVSLLDKGGRLANQASNELYRAIEHAGGVGIFVQSAPRLVEILVKGGAENVPTLELIKKIACGSPTLLSCTAMQGVVDEMLTFFEKGHEHGTMKTPGSQKNKRVYERLAKLLVTLSAYFTPTEDVRFVALISANAPQLLKAFEEWVAMDKPKMVGNPRYRQTPLPRPPHQVTSELICELERITQSKKGKAKKRFNALLEKCRTIKGALQGDEDSVVPGAGAGAGTGGEFDSDDEGVEERKD